MRKRVGVILAVLTALVAGGYVALWATATRHNITMEGFNAIQQGMTQVEVEEILGVPQGDYASGRVAVVIDMSSPPAIGSDPSDKHWWSDDLLIVVRFGEDGRVSETRHSKCYPFSRGNLLGRLRRWLGL